MKSDWDVIELNLVAYKDTGLNILSSIDDIQVLLDDHIVKSTTMKNSPFIKPFETELNEWDQQLVRSRVCFNKYSSFLIVNSRIVDINSAAVIDQSS